MPDTSKMKKNKSINPEKHLHFYEKHDKRESMKSSVDFINPNI